MVQFSAVHASGCRLKPQVLLSVSSHISFKQLDMKASRNEAAEHEQQTLRGKTWGSNQQTVPNFSRLTHL